MSTIPAMWADSPAVTRLLIAGYPALSLSLMLLEKSLPALLGLPALPVQRIFACSLKNLGDLCIWTVATSSFYEQFAAGFGLLMLLMELYMCLQYLPTKERELGSFTFLLWIILAGAAANLIFLVFMGAQTGLSALQSDERSRQYYYQAANSGMWPLLMVVLSLNCLGNPGGVINFWGVLQIPSKWYPAFFVGLFCLLNQHIMWNLLAGIAVGYAIYVRPHLHFEKLLPSQSRISGWEQRFCSQQRGCLRGTWLAAGSTGYAAVGRQGPAPSLWGQPQHSNSSRGASSFTVFSGAGNRLGDGSPTSTPRPADVAQQDGMSKQGEAGDTPDSKDIEMAS